MTNEFGILKGIILDDFDMKFSKENRINLYLADKISILMETKINKKIEDIIRKTFEIQLKEIQDKIDSIIMGKIEESKLISKYKMNLDNLISKRYSFISEKIEREIFNFEKETNIYDDYAIRVFQESKEHINQYMFYEFNKFKEENNFLKKQNEILKEKLELNEINFFEKTNELKKEIILLKVENNNENKKINNKINEINKNIKNEKFENEIFKDKKINKKSNKKKTKKIEEIKNFEVQEIQKIEEHENIIEKDFSIEINEIIKKLNENNKEILLSENKKIKNDLLCINTKMKEIEERMKFVDQTANKKNNIINIIEKINMIEIDEIEINN